MELGEKLKKARLEAGLSQRQLCGEEITRNMLSQIENGTAKPSMATLSYLAARLNKPVSWFLDTRAEEESILLESVLLLQKAGEALEQGRDVLAAELLAKITDPAPEVRRQKLLLSAKIPGANHAQICGDLPSLDEELLLRATVALEGGALDRCGHLLEAAEDHSLPEWSMIRGKLHLQLGEYSDAAACFHRVEDAWPVQADPLLEVCYRELGDFQKAYFYACRQR